MKKKVLFIGRFPPPMHGAAKMNNLYYKSKNIRNEFKVKKIKINSFDSLEEMGKYTLSKFIGFFKVLFTLIYQLTIFRPNIVYFELAATGVAFYRDSIYVIICKLFRKKIIFAFHSKGISSKLTTPFTQKYYKYILRKTKIILLSPRLYNDIEKIVPKKNVKYIGNGIFDEITDKEFIKIINSRKKQKKITLLYLSNMIESKGPIDTLKICKGLQNKKINFECLFVGNFQDIKFKKTFEEKLKKLSLEKECKYLGPKYNQEKNEILSKTHFLIFPTTYPIECYPLVILEAFMFGIYVLSYDNAAIKDIISHPNLGKVANQNNYQELEKDIKKRITNPPNTSFIRKTFKKDYTFNISETKLLSLLKHETK